MNWQLIRNVPPHRDRIFMLSDKKMTTLFFGELTTDENGKDWLFLSTSIFDGGLGRAPIRYDWAEYCKRHPYMYWSTFVKP